MQPHNYVTSSQFSSTGPVTVEVSLASSPFPYVIIPMTYVPNYCMEFTLSVTSTSTVELVELDGGRNVHVMCPPFHACLTIGAMALCFLLYL